MRESGLLEIIPQNCILTAWGLSPVFLHPESPLRVHCGVGSSSRWLDGGRLPLFTGMAGGILCRLSLTIHSTEAGN